MNIQSVGQLVFGFSDRPVVVQPVEEQLSTDAGLIPIRQFDERLGYTAGFAAQLRDTRVGSTHALVEMVRQRVFGILAGYADQNDHDALRSDPIFKLIAGRTADGDDLASQPTLSRMENRVTPADLLRLEEWFLEQFVASFDSPPSRLTLDLDVFDDPTHGAQQLTFFHGFYGQYQYLVRLLTCAENDLALLPALLHGTAHPALGIARDLTRVVTRLREAWPDVQIHVRADAGYATPAFYEACERLGIDYTVGFTVNPVVQRNSEETLNQAVSAYETTGRPQRLFTAFEYQAKEWPQARWMIVKCEAQAAGTNRRAVITNRPGGRIVPEGAYDGYADRGESENRNKELKCEFEADRLSDHRYLANLFRLMMHTLACNLHVRLRRLVAQPPEPRREEPDLPAEARPPRQKRAVHNDRRAADPLGEGHACTWRMRVIKVAARVVTSVRRVCVLVSQSWPFWDDYEAVSRAVLKFCGLADDASASGDLAPAPS